MSFHHNMRELPRMADNMSGPASEFQDAEWDMEEEFALEPTRTHQVHTGPTPNHNANSMSSTTAEMNPPSKRKRNADDNDSEDEPTKKELGADGKPRGQVRNSNGQLQWRNKPTDDWAAAVYHASLRERLLRQASNNYTKAYVYEHAHTNIPFDETAHHEEQRDWSAAREHWPKMRNDILNRLEKLDYDPKYSGKDVSHWILDGQTGELF